LERALGPIVRNLQSHILQSIETDPSGLFLAAVFLADAEDEQLASHCQRIAVDCYRRGFCEYSNIKDFLRELDYRGHKPQWLRRWIESGEHVEFRDVEHYAPPREADREGKAIE
jgi:hypothetical protein